MPYRSPVPLPVSSPAIAGMHASDRSLTKIERARFEAVYRQHREEVVSLLRRRLDNPDDVAELAQEAFLRILRYRQCEPESLKHLLIRIVLNLAASHGARARQQRQHVALEDETLVSNAPALEDDLAEEQQVQHTLHAVQTLPTRCRQVFLLRLVHGLRQREIAQRCGVSTRMVEMHLAKAQGLLRARMIAAC